ncbi:hypothetical protein Hypma_013548 [Hypsizygus marmoreus]|uniref:Uncharacterized protein n=1 Tax=Hypsizygus marmoreus TaxID=39966 RepID=A0A369JJ37_HYPMA|nr:hypothetical protein Hypma_013548 [Hypsizygus marmoreus]
MEDIPLSDMITPPYLTSEPGIKAIETKPGDFLGWSIEIWTLDTVETVAAAPTIPTHPLNLETFLSFLVQTPLICIHDGVQKSGFLYIDNNAAERYVRLDLVHFEMI